MVFEHRKLDPDELVIKKIDDLTIITPKKTEPSSLQVITYIEYPNKKKYLAIAPREINGHFAYVHASFIFYIRDLELNSKNPFKEGKVILGLFNPKNKKFSWESNNKKVKKLEDIILKKEKKKVKKIKIIKRI